MKYTATTRMVTISRLGWQRLNISVKGKNMIKRLKRNK